MYDMMFQFSNPLLFLLIGLIPLILLINHGTRVEAARWRSVTTLVLRLGAVLCLILALVGTQQREREDLLSVVFLLDVSDSVPLSQQVKGIERIHTPVDALKPTDAFSVLLFAGQASIRLPMQPKAEQGHLTPDILSDTAFNQDATDIASAIQLAMNIFPEERQKRMVLLSDGVQNVGEASEILDLVRASEIELFTIPLNSERENEVWVRDLQLPPQVRSGETFHIRAIIESAVEAQVTAQLYRNSVLVIPAQALPLKPGKQTVDFPQQLFDEGNYEYQLKFFVADSISENNTAYGFTRVHGRPHILYVEDAPEYAAPLKTVLEANRFAVQVISPSEFPTHPVGLQNSDVVIISNVSADALSESQMEMIESYVRDVGKGLVVIGGGHAFGMGGYHE
ncbi:VWA domain-containing protein [Candidatus Poribacteria bacterium]|nr:VWA domain-containing protein [Candidatus Poribacteria bacterium]